MMCDLIADNIRLCMRIFERLPENEVLYINGFFLSNFQWLNYVHYLFVVLQFRDLIFNISDEMKTKMSD